MLPTPPGSAGYKKKIAASLLGLASMSCLVALTLAACSSSSAPASEEHIAEVEQAYVPAQNNPPCGASACPSGQVLTCGDVCVTPVAVGHTCTQNDCQANSVCDPHLGASCVPVSGTKNFVCALPPFGKTILSACDPLKNECPADTFCIDEDRCYPDTVASAFCVVGITEGGECDSNWTDVYTGSTGPAKCSPCMPGTACINGFCHKPCTPSLNGADCPCGNNGETNQCITGISSPTSNCFVCATALHEACDSEHPCCSSTQKCGGPAGSSTCCKNIGQNCTTQADCCENIGEVCLGATGKCGACKSVGQSCTANADCCDGTCTGGACVFSCTASIGKKCTASGVLGECQNSTITCSATGATQCLPTSPTVETCDGKDNDCNGTKDDIPFEACTTPVSGDVAGCQSGFTTSGHFVCENKNKVCRAKPQHDYCINCGPLDDNSADCGTCSATPCTPGTTKCIPNFVCAGSGTTTCQDDSTSCPHPTPTCWHPSDTHAGSNCF